MAELLMGIDIGGTNTRLALARRGNLKEVLVHHSFSTPSEKGPDIFLEMLEEAIAQCLEQIPSSEGRIAGVGCTLPGILNAETGTALFVSNLRGWDGFPLAERLSSLFDVPISVENDVNAAALGEYRYGAGLDCQSIVYFTISTGVAAGIVLDGRVWRGHNHAAGELGFFVPDPSYIDKDWQPNGCLELTSAGVGLARIWRKLNPNHEEPVTAVDVFEAAEREDERAVELVEQATVYLAQSIIAVCTLLDPQRIVLSGSIAENQSIFLRRFREVISFIMPRPQAPDIMMSTLQGDAPLMGALAGIEEKLSPSAS